MMRKDVQFGLTIGGSLAAILVIWVSLVDFKGSKKVQDVSLAPATMPSDATASAPQNVAPPIDLTTPSGPATQPASVADSSTSTTGQDWNRLLQTGNAPTLSATTPEATTQPALASAMLGSSSPLDAAPPAGITPDSLLASPSTRPSSAMASTGGRTHKVVAGESFFTIAVAVYGDGHYFSRIEDANPNVNPNRLKIGTVLVIPSIDGPIAHPSQSAASTSGTATLASASLKPGATADLDPSKSYRVQPSDTLMGIARKLYGDGQEWQKIYDANKDVIGANPARLKVNMVLRLPVEPTVVSATTTN
jgi:nucleoid-associated protein YgaU